HPAHGVDDVGLAAAVGPHHADQLTGDGDDGGVDERFESGEFELGQSHRLRYGLRVGGRQVPDGKAAPQGRSNCVRIITQGPCRRPADHPPAQPMSRSRGYTAWHFLRWFTYAGSRGPARQRDDSLKRGFYLVMAAQALSSLADNALFIAAIALIQELRGPDWMAPMMKWWFAAAYVLLAAFVGAFADSYPKGRVMFATNALKVAGCLLMFWYASLGLPQSHQVLVVCAAYGLVGLGAAAYSPAKYGIVTEMLPPDQLVKGNSWI